MASGEYNRLTYPFNEGGGTLYRRLQSIARIIKEKHPEIRLTSNTASLIEIIRSHDPNLLPAECRNANVGTGLLKSSFPLPVSSSVSSSVSEQSERLEENVTKSDLSNPIYQIPLSQTTRPSETSIKSEVKSFSSGSQNLPIFSSTSLPAKKRGRPRKTTTAPSETSDLILPIIDFSMTISPVANDGGKKEIGNAIRITTSASFLKSIVNSGKFGGLVTLVFPIGNTPSGPTSIPVKAMRGRPRKNVATMSETAINFGNIPSSQKNSCQDKLLIQNPLNFSSTQSVPISIVPQSFSRPETVYLTPTICSGRSNATPFTLSPPDSIISDSIIPDTENSPDVETNQRPSENERPDMIFNPVNSTSCSDTSDLSSSDATPIPSFDSRESNESDHGKIKSSTFRERLDRSETGIGSVFGKMPNRIKSASSLRLSER